MNTDDTTKSARWNTLDAENYLSRTVYVADDKPVSSGLLDANGVRLVRQPERRPIGFVVWP